VTRVSEHVCDLRMGGEYLMGGARRKEEVRGKIWLSQSLVLREGKGMMPENYLLLSNPASFLS